MLFKIGVDLTLSTFHEHYINAYKNYHMIIEEVFVLISSQYVFLFLIDYKICIATPNVYFFNGNLYIFFIKKKEKEQQ